MQFKITSSIWGDDTPNLINKYPGLHKYGFAVVKKVHPQYIELKDECGNFKSHEYACQVEYTPSVYIYSLEELISLSETVGYELIVDGKKKSIEIYDGYRE